MKLLFTWLGLLFALPALGQQTHFSIDRGEETWAFDMAWTNAKQKARSAQFKLDAGSIQADVDTLLMFQKADAHEAIIAAVRKYTKTLKGVDITVKVDRSGNLNISGTGKRKKLKAAAKEIKRIQEAALKAYMREHGFTHVKGKITPVHAKHAYRYADKVRPIAEALGAGEIKRRTYAARALTFVQSSPYEKGQKGKADKGFRLPLSVLANNMGDCDSKATLYLSLLKAAHPGLDTTIVYIPGHAFVGLGLKPRKGDVTFKARGKTWVMAEPVGPALAPLGDGDKRSKARARKGRFKTRQVKDN
jgi:hypothetical protein